jgi:ketopantoate reductase
MMTSDVTIVGMGRIGRVLGRAAEAAGARVSSVTRVGGDPAATGLIILAVGEDDLENAAARFSTTSSARLVFVQNGLLVDVMARYPGAGRGLLHFNADAQGRVRVLMPSIFGGSLVADLTSLAKWLTASDIPARFEPEDGKLRVEEIRKLLWSTVLSVLAATEKIPVGRVPTECAATMDALARECIAVAATALQIDPPVDDLLSSLPQMAAALPDYAGSARGQRYRNALLIDLGDKFKIPTPNNRRVVKKLSLL